MFQLLLQKKKKKKFTKKMNFSSNCSNNNNNNNNNGNNNNNDNLNNSIALLNTEYFINDYTTPSISELNKFEAILNSLNISNAASDRDPTRFTLPIWRQILWSFFYAAMILVGTGGNLIVIWIVLAHKRMRTVTNYFLLNLSIADTMSSTLNVTFNYVYMLYSHWPFGETYCKITQFIAAISVCASVFSLMSISIDRYMAIMTPLKPRMGRFVTLVLAILTWVFGILIGTPSLLYFRTHMEVYANGERRIVCYPNWPDADAENNHSVMDFYFNILFLIITYIIPIFSMSYTYTKVGLELWGSQSIGEVTQRQMENIKSKRRVVKMMMVVVIMFAVCWLPYQLYFIAISCYPEINNTEYIQETFLGIYWLAMSNSMYNPIIYCWMNARFRRGFKQVFASWVPFMKKKPSTTLTRRQVLTSKRRSGSVSPDRNRGVVVAKNTGSGGTPTLRVSYNPNKSIQGAGTDPAPVTAAICNPSTSSNQIRLSSLSHNNQHHHHQRDSTASSSTTINNTSTFCFIHHHHPPPLLSQAEEKEDDIMMIRRCDDGIVRCDAERLNLS